MATEIIEKYDTLDLATMAAEEATKVGPVVVSGDTTSITVDAVDIQLISLPVFVEEDTADLFRKVKAVKVQLNGKDTWIYDGIGKLGVTFDLLCSLLPNDLWTRRQSYSCC